MPNSSVYYSRADFQRHLQKVHFHDCCQKARQALKDNPQGLTIQQVQSSAGLSIQTTKLVVNCVAIELKGRFYPKLKP